MLIRARLILIQCRPGEDLKSRAAHISADDDVRRGWELSDESSQVSLWLAISQKLFISPWYSMNISGEDEGGQSDRGTAGREEPTNDCE